jgi:peptide/nickel transport system substrate-binding protein
MPMIVSLLLAACAQPAPPAAPAAAPTTAPATAPTTAPAKPAATTAPAKPAATTGPAAAPTTAPTPAAAAATTAPAAATKTGGTVVVGWTQETTNCDYTTLVVIGGGMITCPEYNQEPLVRYDEAKDQVVPALATSWDEKPDSITFHLRGGVKFQDGTPFNADAVVFNFRRAFDKTFPANQALIGTGQPGVPYTYLVPAYKDVTKVDDMTVRVDIAPTPFALRTFSTPATFMESPTAVQAEGADYSLKPVGTGPYKVVSFEPNQRWELTRNDDYWGQKPAPDRVIAIVKTDPAALVNDLLSGNIDAMVAPPPANVDQLKAASFVVNFYPTLEIDYLALNTTKPPFDDVMVRQAANWALDKEALAKVLNGQGAPIYADWFQDAYGYNGDVTDYKYNPDKARQLLDQAGWKLPSSGTVRQKNGQDLSVKLVMRIGQTGVLGALPTVATSNLQDVGFKVDLQAVDAATYNSTTVGVFSPTCCDLSNAGHASSFPDPIDWLTRWTTASIPPGERNFAFWSNKDFDNLVAQAKVELDPNKRLQLLKDAQKLMRDQAPIMWGNRYQTPVAWNPSKIQDLPLTKAFSRVSPWAIVLK